jgi:simple sugar transport system substrate-binding protein
MARSVGLCAAAVLAAALSLAGCQKADEARTGAEAGAKKQLVVGFAQTGAESSWRTAETNSMRKEAEARGIKLLIAFGQGQQANQIKAIRSFITQKVDAIVLAPIVETGWEPVLTEAKQAGVPVILVDRGVKVSDNSLYVTLIASDFVAEGEMAAEWLAKKLGGKGTIAELEGTTGAAPAIDRKKGFDETLAKKYPDMKVVLSQSADFETGKGKEVMEAFLKSDKGRQLQAVYAHNDDMALGAIQAIQEAGMKPGQDILVVSIDGVKPAFEAMVKGTLNATVECNPLFGPITFDTLRKVLAGEAVPKYIKNEDQLFDQSTAAQVIGSREY